MLSDERLREILYDYDGLWEGNPRTQELLRAVSAESCRVGMETAAKICDNEVSSFVQINGETYPEMIGAHNGSCARAAAKIRARIEQEDGE